MTMKVRALISLMLVAVAMELTGCGHYTCGATFGNSTCSSSTGGLGQGGGTSSGTVMAFLMSETPTSPPSMAADRLDLSTNTFTLLGSAFTPPPFTQTLGALDGGTAVVSLTSQKYLYIPFDDNTLFGYVIDGTTGALTEVVGDPFLAVGGTSIAADPAGRFLYVSDFSTGDITAFTINATSGVLTSVGAIPSGISAAQMSTDGQGKFLYATEGLGGLNLAAFAINQTTGALTAVGSPMVFSPGMAQVAGEKSGKFLLGISGTTGDNKIHVFGINGTTGALTEVSGSPFPTVTAPTSIVVHPTGSFVYSFFSAADAVEGYQINPTSGALTAISGSPFAGAKLAEGQFDQSGKFLFGVGVGNVGSPTFGPYPTDPTTGIVSATTFTLEGFPGGGFAVTDLDNAP